MVTGVELMASRIEKRIRIVRGAEKRNKKGKDQTVIDRDRQRGQREGRERRERRRRR